MFNFTKMHSTQIQYENICNSYDDSCWGQHISIENSNNNNIIRKRHNSASSDCSKTSSKSGISLKEYLDNLVDDDIPNYEPNINIVPAIRNPNELEVIYYSKLPIIIKAALYLYKFACYCSGYN